MNYNYISLIFSSQQSANCFLPTEDAVHCMEFYLVINLSHPTFDPIPPTHTPPILKIFTLGSSLWQAIIHQLVVITTTIYKRKIRGRKGRYSVQLFALCLWKFTTAGKTKIYFLLWNQPAGFENPPLQWSV